ncbi:MAG: hypothetical protein HY321_04195 [Armatimonadetes bacterium]|nr:hypothetical protein [Armatimonadota bacterium]
MDRHARARIALYAFIVFFGVMIWYPLVRVSINNSRVERRLRETIAVAYTTDTRGFLETCG